MPHPTMTTSWPIGADLTAWLTENAVSPQTAADLVDDMIADASSKVYEKIDPSKLPEDEDECPRTVARAIVLEAARLLWRRQTPHGVAAFGEVAVRLRTVDADVEELLQHYMMDPEP